MTQSSPVRMQSTEAAQKRPKGILKNSYRISPTHSANPSSAIFPPQAPPNPQPSPELEHGVSDKEITLQNTLQNAGHRRNSSNARAAVSRRLSGHSSGPGTGPIDDDENNPRLKWDEANLYLTEQEKSSTMKIDEPKTPYARRYDPSEDEDETHTLDADDIVVDELDKATGRKSSRTREDEIPGLELGDPEEAVQDLPNDESRITRSGSLNKGEKQVVVDPSVDAEGGHGEQAGWSKEEKEKHRRFEEMRKKHYEMKDVKGLLGHPEKVDIMDEDDDSPQGPPEQLPIHSRERLNGS